MRRKYLAGIIGLVLLTVWSCGHSEIKKEPVNGENRVLQQEDGIVSLKLDKAGCYCDMVNPSNNTADWNVVISKPGHFKVWLSSATKDTAHLRYNKSVRISLLDNQLEANPACDKIIQNSSEVHYPYYRADSYMGSVYVSEPGEYNVQVISEKVTSRTDDQQSVSHQDDTRILSVILTPVTR